MSSLQLSVSTANLPPIFVRGDFETPWERTRVKDVADLQHGQAVKSMSLDLALKLGQRETQRKLAPVIADLKTLREEERNAEHPITDFAYWTAYDVLSAAYREINEPLSKPAIAPDEVGGIRIEWSKNQRNIKAVIPSSSTLRTYIYHRRDDESGIGKLSGLNLAEYLKSIILEP